MSAGGPVQDDRRGPGLRFPPPLLAVLLIGAAWLMHRYLPLPLVDQDQLRLPGYGLIVVALMLIAVAFVQFRRAQTHIEPWQPTTHIIESGIFRYSRNPIYLAFCLATLGAGLVMNSWWGVLAPAPLAWLLQRLVIRKEEIYLEAKFGEAYLAYRNRVRRWF